jgi:hypothetical protein
LIDVKVLESAEGEREKVELKNKIKTFAGGEREITGECR